MLTCLDLLTTAVLTPCTAPCNVSLSMGHVRHDAPAHGNIGRSSMRSGLTPIGGYPPKPLSTCPLGVLENWELKRKEKMIWKDSDSIIEILESARECNLNRCITTKKRLKQKCLKTEGFVQKVEKSLRYFTLLKKINYKKSARCNEYLEWLENSKFRTCCLQFFLNW